MEQRLAKQRLANAHNLLGLFAAAAIALTAIVTPLNGIVQAHENYKSTAAIEYCAETPLCKELVNSTNGVYEEIIGAGTDKNFPHIMKGEKAVKPPQYLATIPRLNA